MLGNLALSLWLGSSSVNYVSQVESRQSQSIPRTEASASNLIYLVPQKSNKQIPIPKEDKKPIPRQAALWFRDDTYDTLECPENLNNRREDFYQRSTSEQLIPTNSPLFDRRILSHG